MREHIVGIEFGETLRNFNGFIEPVQVLVSASQPMQRVRIVWISLNSLAIGSDRFLWPAFTVEVKPLVKIVFGYLTLFGHSFRF